MATLRNFILPIEQDALTKRAQTRAPYAKFAAAAKSGGPDTLKAGWIGAISKGNGKPYGPQPAPSKTTPAPKTASLTQAQQPKRLEVVGGWPGVKGKVYLDEPVPDRFGEVIVVFKDPQSGYLKSKVVGEVQRPIEKRRSIFTTK